ncbi:hypothetical protein JB92DRAFT_3143616 [Gautieria morchelliformis]|nr:hypothetical protein JB92DRAFT_3143616 [Gautieria morchelliformis]
MSQETNTNSFRILSTVLPGPSTEISSAGPTTTGSRALAVTTTTTSQPRTTTTTSLLQAPAATTPTTSLPEAPAVTITTTSPQPVSSTPMVPISVSLTGSLVPTATTPLISLPAVSGSTHTSTTTSAPQATHTATSTSASAPQASHSSSAILIGAVVGGITFFLVCLILMLLLRRRHNAALLSTQTETHTGTRRWHALGRIFHTQPPADTTPFRLSEAETGAGRGAPDLNQKQGIASHALPLVTQLSAIPARSAPGQASDGLPVNQSVMSEDQLPSYSTIERVGAPSRDTPLI